MATCPDSSLQPLGWAAVLGVPLAAAAAALAVLASGTNQALFEAVNAWPATTGDAPWINLTVLGESSAMLALSALFLRRRRGVACALVFGALLLTPLLHGMKDLLSLPRPVRVLGLDAVHVIGPVLRTRSFPSGHTTTVFAAAALAWSLLPSAGARTLVLATAVLAALSRLAVGAHWPLDILCGAILGWLGGCAAVLLSRRFTPRPGPRWQWVAVALPALACARILWFHEAQSPRTPMHFALVAIAILGGGWLLTTGRENASSAPALAPDAPE